MKQVTVITLSEDLTPVTEAIIKQGCLHPVQLEEFGEWANQLSKVIPTQSPGEMQELEKRVEKLSLFAGIDTLNVTVMLHTYKEVVRNLDLDNARAEIESLDSKYLSLMNGKKSLEEKYAKTGALQSSFSQYKTFIDFTKMQNYAVLHQFIGKIPSSNMTNLKTKLDAKPHLIIPVREEQHWTTIVLFVLKNDADSVLRALHDFSFEAISVPPELRGSPDEILAKIEQQHKDADTQQLMLREQEHKLKNMLRSSLPPLAYFIRLKSLLQQAQKYIRKTNRTCIISGWVPAENVEHLRRDIMHSTHGKCYIEIRDEDQSEIKDRKKIPFKFKENVWLKPFKMLVQSYGIPEHGSIDPTPIFALTFIFMFGFMFGDVGDGLVISLIGLYLGLHRKATDSTKCIGALFLYCGLISTLFGFLYGSIFGYETIIPALWLHPMHDIDILLQVALYFGIGMITLGILINIINGIRTRNWTRALFDKSGLLAGILYWGVVGLLFKSYFLGHPTSGAVWGIALGVPIGLLFLKGPFEKLFSGGHHEDQGLFGYLMEMFFEVIEIFMGYLANTFSFIRVGAFALSHAGLFAAIFSLCALVKESTFGGFWSFLVLIFGNILILLLEGMVVTIQSIRLEYYEFFSKFFVGDGELFQPLSLKKNS